MIISPEFEIGDAVGIIRKQIEKFVEALRRRVVGAGRTYHVDPLEAQLPLKRPKRIDLAGDADHGDPAVAFFPGGLQKRQKRSVAHAHAPALRHCPGGGHNHRHRPPLVVRIGRHGEDRIDGPDFEKAFGDPRGYARPLRARPRIFQTGSNHSAVRAEKALVRTFKVARAAMNLRFERRVIRPDELARPPAAFGIG